MEGGFERLQVCDDICNSTNFPTELQGGHEVPPVVGFGRVRQDVEFSSGFIDLDIADGQVSYDRILSRYPLGGRWV